MLKKLFFSSMFVIIITTVLLLIVFMAFPNRYGLLMEIEEKYFSTSKITNNYSYYNYDGDTFIRYKDKIILDSVIMSYHVEEDFIYVLQNNVFSDKKGQISHKYNENGFGCKFYRINHMTHNIIGPIDISQVLFSNDIEKDVFSKSRTIFAKKIKKECSK